MKKRHSTTKWKGLLFAMLWTISLGMFAQNITISGNVKDDTGLEVIGATIIVEGNATIGTTTDVDGNYVLNNVPSNGNLVFSYVGMKSQTVAVNGRSRIDVTMASDTELLDEVIVVGYGTQKKVNLTGAVSAVTGDEMVKRPVTNPATMLQGQMPGVRIIQGLGQPGNESVQIRVRGQGTYSSAGSDPLVLIDGVPGSLSTLNANDIESVSVLKDAASASIYGARAANGVVLVTTKSGKDGGFKVNYNANFGVHNPTKMLNIVTNSADYMELTNEAKANSGISTGLYTQDMINSYRNATDRVKYPNFDWLGYMFNSAFVQNHSLSLNGGNKGTTYNITLGYVDQPGTMKGFTFDKYNFRTNVKSDLKDWITVGVNIAMEKGNQKNPRQSHDDAFLSTLSQAPTYMPFLPDGRYVNSAYNFESHNKNMVAIVENDVMRTTTNYDVSSQLWADIKLAKGLSWYSKMAVNLGDVSYKDWRPIVNLYDYHSGNFARTLDVGGEGLISHNNRNYYTNFFTYLKYDFNIDQAHNFGLQAGYSQEYNNYQFLQGYRQKYVTNNLQELNAGTAAVQTANGNTTEWALNSYFGRFNYNYMEKYLFEANVRYDGTSRIAKDTRWGFFPSFSAGWRLTEEDFIKNAEINWLTNAKIRASYGLLGNQNIGGDFPYPYQDLLNFTGDYAFDNSVLSPGVAQSALANSLLKWESTSVADAGLDLQLFGKLNITYDWYRKHTFDILRQAQVTGALGLSAPFVNSGDMLNTGHELTVQYNDRINQGALSGLQYGGGFFVDVFRNKLIKFGAREIDGYVIRENNLPYNSYYMLDAIGIFQTQEEVDNSPTQFSGNFGPGDIKYRDVNGDNVIDNDDRVTVPGRFPKFEYSFNGNASWKGFDLSFLFQGVEGRRIYTDGWGLEPFIQGAAPTLDFVNNRWTGPGTSNFYPKIYYGWDGTNPNRRASTWYLQDASFLRLKNLTVGYIIPANITSKVSIDRIRLYFSGDNLLTFTKYKGLDPERAGDGRFVQYPQNKIVSFGVNVEF
ncbi:TonB-dependent receptor [Petrimonas sp.]|jgi:TonB-linked SusC/RagA family outer membrane protein|uniref:SusC/RagA family TonB-linked outer membrane protein n=1 Tax=Petrimonas sp. TaxID=2023866 RepID=UPI000ED0EFF8|nr:SusC/RagA family TonB-linked outer membrane protein [Porphyromonadaceae bacterium]